MSLITLVTSCALAITLSNQPDPKELILGVWIGVKPVGIQWEFTRTKFIEDDLEYSYLLTKGATTNQCKGPGYRAVYNSDQLVLIQQDEDFKICYMVDYLTKDRLVLFSETTGNYLSFKKK